MLARAGASSVDEIFNDQIPPEFQFKGSFDFPPALSEVEILREVGALAEKDLPTTRTVSFLGGGIYDHFVPSAIMHVANRSEYVTGYTPYQPEASQGLLQAFFEYQTLVSRLMEMPVSNASLYDGASALGEALFMALSVRSDRSRVVLPEGLHPDYRSLAETYLSHFGVSIETAPLNRESGTLDLDALRKLVDDQTAVVVLQHPNYFGCLEEAEEVSRIAHEAGALLTAVVDPVSLGLLAPPGSYGADIAVGEGQGLGLNQYAGGESLGLFTCVNDFIRKVPGRLVGVAKDRENRRGFVLTLQTREQHIRRDKATSNICTNHAHNALRATIYMCLMGPQGMQRVARMCARNTARLRQALEARKPGAIPFSAPTFKELVVRLNRPAREVRDALLAKGFLAGIPLDAPAGKHADHLLVAVTEKRNDAEIDRFAEALGEYL